MKSTQRIIAGLGVVAVASMAFSAAATAGVIYGNNAGYGPDYVYQIDTTTGAITNTYDVSPGNGRGVVVVGNTMYTTTADSNSIYAYDLTTNTSLGTVFSVAGATALSTISFNGTDFWIGDYSGSNNAYLYSPTGTLLDTVSLGNCGGYCDGIAYVPLGGGELISNRGDAVGPYDVYSLSGTLLQSNFIDPTPACDGEGSTGITYDGSNFWVSCIYNSTIGEYSASGAFMGDVTVGSGANSCYGGSGACIEGLSSNYAAVLPTVPEPSTLALFGLGLAGIGVLSLRRRRASGRTLA